ncbi:hypothetical protein [Methylobacterium sp. R2-1]|uniref:hypothetical protein n=1 Tax=Methylobacterium sp. R2-1 TaxID=2587064 RepID=UPI001619B725|nr:hypothetical protein [Methylobacterium sp. R2-1]MBB2965160.1 hypothetical protein [Methylobacterium sp. R2-1]
MTSNPKHWPKGPHCYLDRMVSVLSAGEHLSDDEWDTKAEAIKAVATDYNATVAEHEGADRSEEAKRREKNAARHSHVVDQIRRIEAACNELAASFEEAHPFTLRVFSGESPLGTLASKMTRHVREVGPAFELTRRYHIPFAPNPALPDVQDIMAAGHSGEELRQVARNLDWTHAARALALIASARLRDFEESFHEEKDRVRSIADEGANSSLRPSERGLAALRTENDRRQRRRKTPPSNERKDAGGAQNLADEMYGRPKWNLTRDCYGLLHEAGHGADLSAAAAGMLVEFARDMHAYATGEEPVLKERGDGYKHLADAAVRIMGAWYEHVRQLQHAAMGLASLDEAFHVRWTALQYAHRTGHVPTWIE